MGLGPNKPHHSVEHHLCHTHNKLGKDVSILPRAVFLVAHAGRKYKSSTSEIRRYQSLTTSPRSLGTVQTQRKLGDAPSYFTPAVSVVSTATCLSVSQSVRTRSHSWIMIP